MSVNRLVGVALSVLVVAIVGPVTPAQDAARVQVAATRAGHIEVRSEPVTVTLQNAKGEGVAEIHSYGYFADGPIDRPVMFLWNGGPGASSALLHAGFAAPQVVHLASGGGLVDNSLTMIDRCDLIYVDPVGTGFSRAIGDTEEEGFWNWRSDARAAARFVSTVVSRRGFEGRPIYLCGESYGGIRVAAMLEPLRKLGVTVAGLVMISPALESRTIWTSGRADNLLRTWVDGMPTMAALAVADGKRSVVNIHADVDRVCEFAFGPLLRAVRNDEDVDFDDNEELIAQAKKLMAGRLITRVGARDRYDARQRLRMGYLCGVRTRVLEDSVEAIMNATFGIESIAGYELMNRNASRAWQEPRRGRKRGYPWDLRATEMIAAACKDGAGPRVFVAGGWYDIVVPFAAARRLRKEGAFGNCEVVVKDYPGGHALYVDPAAHIALVRDLRSWLGCKSI